MSRRSANVRGQAEGWCHSCGRLLPSDTKPDPTRRKYCSNTCRVQARSPALGLQLVRQQLARAYHRLLLLDELPAQKGKGKSKGGRRVVMCSEAERVVFWGDGSVERGIEGAERLALAPSPESSAITPTAVSSDGGIAEEHPLDEHPTSPNTVAAATDPTPTSTRKPLTLSPPEAREESRRAARRIVVFGFPSQGIEDARPVEAVQQRGAGWTVVEGSFAKGEWGVRFS